MNCPNCQAPMTSSPSFGERVTVSHECPNCQHKTVVTFDKPEKEYNPFAPKKLASKYPTSDAKHKLITATQSFVIEDSGMTFQLFRHASYRTTVYTSEQTGKQYRVFCMAWEDGNLIRKVLYINGVYQYKGESYLIKHHSDNPFMRFCPSTEKAVLYAMANAEDIVRAMATKDLADYELAQ